MIHENRLTINNLPEAIPTYTNNNNDLPIGIIIEEFENNDNIILIQHSIPIIIGNVLRKVYFIRKTEKIIILNLIFIDNILTFFYTQIELFVFKFILSIYASIAISSNNKETGFLIY